MWKRLKRAMKANLGRFRDDPTASSSDSKPRKHALEDLSENLAVVRSQIAMLDADLQKLNAEESDLATRIKASLDKEDRDTALKHADVLARVRESKRRIEEQLARTRAVCQRAEGIQHEVDIESQELAAAADATLDRIEQDLASQGRIEVTPRKSVGTDSGPAPQASSKTIGGEIRVKEKKTIGGPTDWGGESTERTVIPKTIGSETPASGSSAGKTIGGDPAPEPEPKPEPKPAANEKSGDDLLDELERLGALLEKGILTPEEFAQAKKKLLG